jgi:hypothetical protein
MGLFIRDDAVRDMAKRLAEARHTTMTEAVRIALEHDLAEIQRDRAERDRAIRQIWAELDAMPDREYGDDDMYDDIGAPR